MHHRTALFAIYIALMGSYLWPVQPPVTSIRFLKSNASPQPDSISWAAVPVPFQLSTFPFLSSKDCSSVLFQRNTFQVQAYLDSYLYPLMKADYVCSRLVDRCFCKFCPCLLIFLLSLSYYISMVYFGLFVLCEDVDPTLKTIHRVLLSKTRCAN